MFQALHADGLYRRDFGYVDVALAAVATRTGARARAYKKSAGGRIADFTSFEGADSVERAIAAGVDFVCVASPDDRHFDAAKQAIQAGRHVLIEKPSVLQLRQLDELVALARDKSVLAKVVYHKLCDPDHKKLRTLVDDGELLPRQQRLLLAARAEEHCDGAVRGVDRRTQSRHLRRRPLHQAHRFHVRRHGSRPSPAPDSAASWGRPTATPGTRPSCGWSTNIRTGAKPRSTSTRAGSIRTIFRATSSRKCSSGSTTASGTAIRGSAGSSSRSRARRQRSSRRR